MGHSHLHKRRHQHEIRQDPFSDLENGISSLAGQAASFFGIGNGGGGSQATPPPGPASPNPPASNPAPPSTPAKPTIKSPQTDEPSDGSSGSANTNDNGNGNGDGSNDGPSTVYVTASWTGTGDFSYSTEMPSPTTKVSSPDPATLRTTKSHKTSSIPPTTSSAVAAAATTAAVSSALSSSLSTSFSSPSSSAAIAAATTSAASAAADASSGGLSGGAKAGIAIGVILGVLALVAGAFALYRMKKARDEDAYEHANSSEKNPFSDSAAADRLPPMATPSNYNQPPAPTNPFVDGPAPMGPTNVSNHTPNAANMAMAGIAGAGVGAVVGAAAAEKRNNVPEPLNVNRAQSPALVPPPAIAASPAVSNFSESSLVSAAAVPIGAAGGPPPRMHRVQMDFNPTMDDELGIRAGEIVRILRDFDDGWCTVEIVEKDPQTGKPIRHQQGVVPRTCLSRLPLKPRQRKPGPPGGPGASPPKMNGPMGPGRMQSPALVPNQRSMSPGPYGGGPQPQRPAEPRSRSNSAGDINPRSKPIALGPSPMNPAAQATKDVELPIQSTSPIVPAPLQSGHARTGSVPNPSIPGHMRSTSIGSTASAPVARKPVPRKVE